MLPVLPALWMLRRPVELRLILRDEALVQVASEVTDWRPVATRRQNGYYSATLLLPMDSDTEYKFLVNGEWRIEPTALTVPNGFGTLNNVFHGPLICQGSQS